MTGRPGQSRRRWPRRLAALLLLGAGLLVAHPAGAQGAAGRDSSVAWILRVAGMEGGMACPCHSTSFDVPRDRRLYIMALGARWPLVTGPAGLQVAYEFELLPLIVSHGTADGNLHVSLCDGGRYCATADSFYPWTTTAVGMGVLPLGVTGLVPVAPRLRLRLRASGGILRLSDPVPVAAGRKFNFMADGSAALELRLTPVMSVNVGVVQNHISNGNTSSINPGMDSRMLEVGLVRRR